MPKRTVAVVVGSLRKGSFTRKVAESVARLAPEHLTFDFVEIGQLPHFDQDLEPAPPAAWVEFRKRIAANDAVLFATPEYNRSVPGVLKNAIDVASRPYGQSVWNGKPAAVLSVSPGAIGAFGANHHLRQSLVFLNMPAMPQPEAYVGHADKLFGPDGDVANPQTREFLAAFVRAFADWIEQNSG